MLSGFIRHIRLYALFMRNSLLSYVEYRANFYASMLMEILFLCSKLVYVFFTYTVDIEINGISPDQMLFFTGTYTIMVAVYTGLFMDNFYRISAYVNDGTMDIYITKPVSLLMIISMQHINYALPIPNLIAGITMIMIAVNRLGYTVTLANVILYILILLSCTIVMYCFFLIPQLLSFWMIRTGSVTEILDKSWDLDNMPMAIYGKWFRRLGTYFIPVLFITNAPAMYWTGQLTVVLKYWIVLAPAVFLLLLNFVWRFAVKKYASASS